MRIIQAVGPDLSVGLTDTNRLVIIVDTDDGEHMAEVAEIEVLAQALREMDLVQMENSRRAGPCATTAETDLERRRAS